MKPNKHVHDTKAMGIVLVSLTYYMGYLFLFVLALVMCPFYNSFRLLNLSIKPYRYGPHTKTMCRVHELQLSL